MLARGVAGEPIVIDEATLPVAAHDSVEAAATAFLARSSTTSIDRACLAVAGPVEGRNAQLTNAPWRIDADAFARRVGIDDVELCNDFEAAACGLDTLDASARVTLQLPSPPVDAADPTARRRMLIGAGTGLGVAYLLSEPGRTRIIGGEGGHVAFAPADDEQAELLSSLRPSLGRVTAEHLLSGPGLVRLYNFARRATGGLPSDVRDQGAAAVARRFARGEAEAVAALRLFTSIFGAVAGDHALAVLPLGGVFVGGGIAPRFADAFADGGFVSAFRAKDTHAELMARMPVDLVRDERLGLRGAASRALER